MTNHLNRALALVAAGMLFSAGVWAQTLTQTAEDGISVASEFFGGEPRAVSTAERAPKIRLTYAGTDAISTGNKADITYTLNGAAFSGTVGLNALKLFATDNAPIIDVGVERGDGGSRGDNSVTFEIEVGAVLAPGAYLLFTVPNLLVDPAVIKPTPPDSMVAPGRGVTITASFASTRNRGVTFPDGPVQGSGTDNKLDAYADGAVVKLVKAIAVTVREGSRADIALDSRSAIIDAGVKDPAAEDPEDASGALKVATIIIAEEGTPGTAQVLSSDANVWTAGEVESTLAGGVDITVVGTFNSGDKVYLVAGSTNTAFEISGSQATAELDFGTVTAEILYVPGGEVDLRPATFTASFAYDFDDENAISGPAADDVPAEIGYAGLFTEGYAYGIPKGEGAATSYLRATCLYAEDCSIFVDCDGQDGTAYFGELGSVSKGATGVFSSLDLAEALDGGWTAGRGACDVLSTGPIALQHMLSNGGLVINNTAVVGRVLPSDVGILRTPTGR